MSHNLGLISSLCDRVALLRDGRICSVGTPTATVAGYLQQHSGVGVVDLRGEEIPRVGDGPSRARRLTMVDAGGNPTTSAVWGEPVGFEIVLGGVLGTELIVGVSIRDFRGELILHLTSTDDGFNPVLEHDELVVTVTMPQLILNDGTYFITLWLGDTLNVLHDRVPDCLRFDVTSAADGPVRCQAPVRVASKWNTRAGTSRGLESF